MLLPPATTNTKLILRSEFNYSAVIATTVAVSTTAIIMIAFYFRQSKKIPLLLVLLFVRPLIAEKRLGGGEERNPIDLRNSSIGGNNEGICSARHIPTGSNKLCIAP